VAKLSKGNNILNIMKKYIMIQIDMPVNIKIAQKLSQEPLV
jgi:hypothetical protein